jgi:signal transduction histidine kinase
MKEKATKTEKNLIGFIEDYIRENGKFIAGGKLDFDISGDTSESFLFSFRPFDVAVVLDNLIKNAKTAEARKINVVLKVANHNSLVVIFSDNGK